MIVFECHTIKAVRCSTGTRSGIEVLPVTGNQERVEARANVAVHLRGQDLCECFGHASSPRGEKENSDNHPRFHALMQAFPCNPARRPAAASCQLVSLGLASWQLAATGLRSTARKGEPSAPIILSGSAINS